MPRQYWASLDWGVWVGQVVAGAQPPGGLHCPAEQVVPPPQDPQLPLQPSEPHCLPAQLGVQLQ